MSIEREYVKRLDQANNLSTWAIRISVLALLASGASVYYAYLQTEYARWQLYTSQEQNKILLEQNEISQKQNEISLEGLREQNERLRKHTEILEAEYKAWTTPFFLAKIDVVDAVRPEVRLIIENTGSATAEIESITIDGINITKHPLFESVNFDAPILLRPNSTTSFLTVATIPTTQTTPQSIQHTALMVIVTMQNDSQYKTFDMRVDFSRKLVFPRSYLQWRESNSTER